MSGERDCSIGHPMTHACFIMPRSCRDHAALTKLFEERQQRHPEDGEIVARDRLEELHAESLKLIGPDRFADALACTSQILHEKAFGKIAHGKLGAVGTGPLD